jgi:LysM repeat protein
LTPNSCSSIIEHVFGSRLVLSGVVLLALLLVALGAARPSSGAAPETRYVVEAGDTLWAIASARYEGDPREAIWRIEERNDLASPLLQPGQVLVLP